MRKSGEEKKVNTVAKPVIAPVNPEEAPAATTNLLAEIERSWGQVPNLFQTVACSPTILEITWQHAKAQSHLQLAPRHREAIALRVAQLNRCDYALNRHTVLGRRAGMNIEEILKCRQGISTDIQEQALLALATKIFKDHGHNAGFVLDVAREVGLSDAQIIEVTALVACHSLTHYISSLAAIDVDEMIQCDKE